MVAYFQGEEAYADRIRFPLPDLLLLDLMMPRKNGFEVLKWLQTQPFEDMVVVVFTGSEQPEDLKQAIELGADHFHTKRADSNTRLELVKLLEQYLLKEGPKSKI